MSRTCERITVDVGVILYRQTPTASWSLDLNPVGRPRRRFALHTTDRAKALAIAREHARALLGGTWNVTLSGAPLKDVIETYVNERCGPRLAESTQKIVNAVFIERFIPWAERAGIKMIDAVNAGHIEAYLRETRQERGWANASVNRELAWFRALSRWAVKRGFLRADFTAAVERLREPKVIKFVPTLAQMAEMVSALCPAQADLVRFIFNAGGPRISDALAVRPGDVNLPERFVRFHGEKTKSEYLQPLNDVALEIAKRRVLRAGGGPLFAECGDRHNVLRRWEIACKRAGVPTITPHAIRRAAGSENGKVYGTFAVQRMLNHASPLTTARYTGGAIVVPIANAL